MEPRHSALSPFSRRSRPRLGQLEQEAGPFTSLGSPWGPPSCPGAALWENPVSVALPGRDGDAVPVPLVLVTAAGLSTASWSQLAPAPRPASRGHLVGLSGFFDLCTFYFLPSSTPNPASQRQYGRWAESGTHTSFAECSPWIRLARDRWYPMSHSHGHLEKFVFSRFVDKIMGTEQAGDFP